MSDDRQTPPGAEAPHDNHVPAHQRTLDEPSNITKKKKLSTGAAVGIAISAAFHVALFAYLYKQRFEINQMDYNDEAVNVELIAPPPPPPPPSTPLRTEVIDPALIASGEELKSEEQTAVDPATEIILGLVQSLLALF